MARPSAWTGFGTPKSPHEWPPAPAARNAVAARGERGVRHALKPRPVDADEGVGPPRPLARGQQVPHAAQVALALLADRADEEDRPFRLDAELFQRAREASSAASPQPSSATPGARISPEASRRTSQSVPSGKTVSRCALRTSSGARRAPAPERHDSSPPRPAAAPSSPHASNFARRYSARSPSPNGGAGTAHYRRVLLVELRGALLEGAEGAPHALRPQQSADGLLRRDDRGGGDRHI